MLGREKGLKVLRQLWPRWVLRLSLWKIGLINEGFNIALQANRLLKDNT